MRIVAVDNSNVIELPWRARLRSTDKGKTMPDEANVDIALRHAPPVAGLVRYNAFSNKIEATRDAPWRQIQAGSQWSDRDDTGLMQWLQHQGILIRSAPAVSRCVEAVAHDFAFHPVRDYLKSTEWDGTPRLSTWLSRYMGASGDEQYLAAVGRRWLISAVARVMRPGCQADHTLVLEGLQGVGKSRTARILAVKPEWFADRLPDIHTADAAIQLAGCWIVELAELAAVRRAENEAVKGYLSRTYDNYRPPYGRYRISVPRQCVFVGSTNESAYLTDRTGNRRYWPVACGDIDIEYLERDRDQLWAEAHHAFNNGEPWYLDSEEQQLAAAEQDERVVVTELEQEVANYLEKMELSGTREVEIKQILVYALHFEPDKADYAERAGRIGHQVVGVLKSQGWGKKKTMGRGKLRRTVYEKRQPSQGQEPLPLGPV
jgi:putative DNA primase/helicase